jgi:hypothetical protein
MVRGAYGVEILLRKPHSVSQTLFHVPDCCSNQSDQAPYLPDVSRMIHQDLLRSDWAQGLRISSSNVVPSTARTPPRSSIALKHGWGTLRSLHTQDRRWKKEEGVHRVEGSETKELLIGSVSTAPKVGLKTATLCSQTPG